MKLQELADRLQARLDARLPGSGDTEIHGVAGIEDAGEGELTFVANPKYTAAARTTKASAVIVAPDFPEIDTSTLRVDNPYPGVCPRHRLLLHAARLSARNPPHCRH